MEAVMAKESALERIKKLEEERKKILSEAKTEAVAQARNAISDLKSLGFNYDLVESGKKGGKGTRTSKGGPCLICGFETRPPHDGRQHRAQGKRKKPFTAAGLAELGLARA